MLVTRRAVDARVAGARAERGVGWRPLVLAVVGRVLQVKTLQTQRLQVRDRCDSKRTMQYS